MYTQEVPYTDYKGTARKSSVSFNLDAREVFKLLPQLQAVFKWLESVEGEEKRELTTQEVSEFYTDLEDLLLNAWGEMSEDGQYFRKGGKYEFEESAIFNGAMVHFVFKPEEAIKLLNGMMPPEMIEMAKNADPAMLEAAANSRTAELEAEIARLKAGDTSMITGTVKLPE